MPKKSNETMIVCRLNLEHVGDIHDMIVIYISYMYIIYIMICDIHDLEMLHILIESVNAI